MTGYYNQVSEPLISLDDLTYILVYKIKTNTGTRFSIQLKLHLFGGVVGMGAWGLGFGDTKTISQIVRCVPPSEPESFYTNTKIRNQIIISVTSICKIGIRGFFSLDFIKVSQTIPVPSQKLNVTSEKIKLKYKMYIYVYCFNLMT